MIFRSSKRTGRDRKQSAKHREARRRRLANLMTKRAPQVETLEDRNLLAVVGYDAAFNDLTVDGDAGEADDIQLVGSGDTLTITVGNGDEITLAGDAVANADFVLSTTTSPNDTLTIDLLGSSVATAVINGNDGNDTIDASLEGGVVSSFVDINGGSDDDTLIGTEFDDFITGGTGDDTLIGGPGNDQLLGGDNDDLFVWNNGDGSDIIDGDDGFDEVIVNGSEVTSGGDAFSVTANGSGFLVSRADGGAGLGPFTLDVFTVEQLDLGGGNGNDSFDVTDDLSGTDLTDILLRGNEGEDTFDVAPQLGVNIDVRGDNPGPGGVGDVLNVDLAGASAANLDINGFGTGQYNFTAENPIDYNGIETTTSANGQVTLGAIDFSPGDERLNLVADGGDMVLSVDGTNAIRIPLTDIVGPLVLNGGAGDDSLTIDYSGGNPVPADGVVFNGEGQDSPFGDELNIIGSFTDQVLNYTDTTPGEGNNGNISLDGGPLITYTGLEPIGAGDSVNTILNLPTAFANNALLRNSSDNGDIEIVDLGATFEDTVIPNPSNSLTVNLGDQGDSLQVDTLDSAYAASLIINGGAATDDVTLRNVDLIDTPGRGLWVTGSETVTISGGEISGNSATIGGGILIDDSNTTATITGTTISGNTASGAAGNQGGGGIFNNGANLNIFSSSITNNVADGTLGSGGGIFNGLNGSLGISNSVITGNQAERAGGGIEDASFTLVNLLNVNLDGNFANGTDATSPGNGGGLHVTGNATVNVVGGSASGNSAALEGGGLWNGGGTMNVDGVTISGNTASGDAADDGGGGIFNNGGSLNIGLITPSIIDNNVADGTLGSGGGIFNNQGSLVVSGGSISGNDAERAGGGIEHASSTTLSLTNVTLDNNNAFGSDATSPGNGGGLHITGPAASIIDGGSASGNFAALEGGGLWNGSGTMTVIGTTIDGNTASGDAADDGGGGIFNNGGGLVVTNVNITDNVADGSSGSGGGILNVTGGTVQVFSSIIAGNSASRAGGGIEDASGAGLGLQISNSLLADNITGSAPGNGGGVHVTGAGDVSITGGTVSGNSAALEGGGLWNGSGTMTITNVTISGNTASGDAADDGGGGIFNNGGVINIANASISENTADGAAGSGGGILNLGGSVSIVDSLIADNSAQRAGGGIEDNGGTRFNVTNSVIASNDAGSSPGNGGGIHISGGGNVTIDGSTIHDNTAVEGGGLWNSGSGTFTVTNTTISGNTATGSDGGGIFNVDGGSISLDSVTITLNDASTGIGAGIQGGSGGVTIENTIVAQNPGPANTGLTNEANLAGNIDSLDFNLTGDADNGTLTGLTRNTIFSADALLLPLADNGGPFIPAVGSAAPTHLPAVGSAAIGFGLTSLQEDQRDLSRPQGGADDIGAVEAVLNGFVIDADDLAIGTAGDGNADEFVIRNDDTGLTGDIQILINSRLVFSQPRATTGEIVIRGSADDDTLVIDNSNGLIGSNIVFDGDGTGGPLGPPAFPTPGGFDTIRSVGFTTTTEVVYNPGSESGDGALFHVDNQVVQSVEFFGLEPLQVLAPVGGNNILNIASAPLGVGFPQALNAANSINYSEGPNSNDPADIVFAGAITGLITVDGFESLEFANFEVMNIDGGSGSDEINLNHPSQPDELGEINVDGGGPSADGDLVVVNGTTATDTVTIDELTVDGADITEADPLRPELTVSGAEGIVYVSQGGSDDLVVETPSGLQQISLTTGDVPNNGSVAINDPAGNSFVGIEYRDLDVGTADSSITFQDEGGGRADDLIYQGTATADVVNIDAAGRIVTQELVAVSSANKVVVVETPGIRNLSVNGLGGDDEFQIPGNHPFENVLVEAGAPAIGSDVLDFVGSGAGAVTLDLDAQTITEAGFGPVSYSGVETVNINAGNTLTVEGTAGNDTIDITPTAAGAGTFAHNGSPTVSFNYENATTTTINGGGGVDNINVLGDELTDVVTAAAASITVDGSTVTLGTGIEAVSLSGLGGDDNIDLSALDVSITVSGGAGNDTIVGGLQADTIFGNEGNDDLVGGGGADTVYGGIGNDTIGGAAAGAQDPGNDIFSGGDGIDLFIWEPGDGQDTISGGDDAADVFEFRGRGQAGDTFTLSNDNGHVDAMFNAAVINVAGVETIVVAPGDGAASTVTVNDLFGTEVSEVSVDLPAGGQGDTVTVATRSDDDSINVSGTVAITGLTYDVSISDSVAGEDTLVLNLGEGNDTANVETGLPIDTTVNGGAGDDAITGDFNTADGGAGSDTISGSDKNQAITGGSEDDTIVISGGDDTVDGGAGFDNLLYQGTSANDILDLSEAAGTITVSGLIAGTVVPSNVEQIDIDAGDGDDTSALQGLTIPTVFEGGSGADEAIATTRNADNTVATTTPISLVLRGGSGNDILIGGSLGDILDGGDGDDLLEGAQGADQFFGGDGSDQLRWIAGDGSDLMEGGAGETDQLIFIANDASNLLQLYGGGLSTDDPAGIFPPQTLENSTRAIFELNAGQVFLNTGDVESVYIDARDGNDNIVINNQVDATSRGDSPVGGGVAISQGTDLAATAVASVEVLDGLGDDYIDVHGTAGDDNIDVAVQGGATVIEGASVFVQIGGVGGADTLHVHGQEGDDDLKAADGTEAVIAITLEGDAGDDILSADAILIGGAGDDFLQGGAGNDLLIGGAGEDTFVGGAGDDTIDGGDGFDTILIEGTGGADVIDVFQSAPTTLEHTVNGDAQTDTLVVVAGVQTVEEARIVGGNGADLVRVNWLDAHGVNANADALRMTVEGGSDATSDRLIVVDEGTDDLVLYRKGQANDSGTVQVGPGNAEPLLAVFSGVENIDFVDENGTAITNDPAGSQLVVFKHDPFESNDDRFTATYLGSGDTINVDPTIDPGPLADPFGDGQNFGGDSDYYRVVAEATGTLDFQVYFRQVAALASGRPGLPNDGNLDINVRDAAGNVIAGFGANDADDDERVRIPAVEGQTYYLEVVGNGDAINVYNFSIVNHAPPVPFDLELLDNPADGTTNPPGTSANSDTGRSQFDNITYDDTPTIYFRLDDGVFLNDIQGNTPPGTNSPPDETIVIPFRAGVAQPTDPGFAIAIFDEGNTPPQTGNPVQTPLGFATAVAGQQGVYEFTVPNGLALSEGSHFLSARVQMIDPANPQQTAYGERSASLEIVVDTTEPEVVFGLAASATDGLHPNSDSGDAALPLTLVDHITNVEVPTFFGRAEANAIIRLYVDMDGTGTLTANDLLIGQSTATPLDGTEQLGTPAQPNEPGGQWEVTSTVNMNDPRILTALGLAKDGLRTILLSAEDVAGNITDPNANVTLNIFVDTQGPQVTDVFITGNPAFNIFNLKPDTPEPTPRVDSLTISVQDLPPRVAAFLYPALSNVPPLAPVVLVGDHSGPIAIESWGYIDTNSGPGVATGEIVLNFSSPLPDDRFTLTLKDNVIDPAGNQLDGENDAAEPIGTPFFPTGDAIPGGDFIARFTVDSRPEIATWSQGVVYADINGNFVYDPEGEDNDATNRDFVFNFGEITDAYFTGNFSDAAAVNASGFDKLGAYGRFNGVYQFLLDTDDDGVGDFVSNSAFQIAAIPVAGDFNAAHPGDEIGLFDGQNWYLDTNGNNVIDAGEILPSNLRGVPFVGDFNGDGFDDLAVYDSDGAGTLQGQFQFDLDRDGTVDDVINHFGFPGFGEKPVAGDYNLDGIDDIGLWVPHQEGQLPKEAGEFHFLISDNVAANPSSVFNLFSPAPLGNDLHAQFGDDFALPLFGNFDPPVVGDSGGTSFLAELTNDLNPLDTTVDGKVTARDALVVINALNRTDFDPGSNPLRVVSSLGGYRLDASGDGDITSLDALRVINGLAVINNAASLNAESVSWATAADDVLGDLDDDEDDDLISLLASDQEQQRVKS